MQLRRLAVVFTLALLTLMGSLLVSVSPALAHCSPGVSYVTAIRKNGVEVRIYADEGYMSAFNYVYHIYRTTEYTSDAYNLPASATHVGTVYGNSGPNQQYLFVDEHAPLVDLYYWMKPEEISYPHPDGNPIEECGAWRANPFSPTPTVYTRLSGFVATASSTRNQNAISWTSVSERDRFGNNHVSYKLYRNTTTSFSGATLLTTINATSPGSSTSHFYATSDTRPTTTTKYYYWVQVVLSNGTTDRYGPRLADPSGGAQ